MTMHVPKYSQCRHTAALNAGNHTETRRTSQLFHTYFNTCPSQLFLQ